MAGLLWTAARRLSTLVDPTEALRQAVRRGDADNYLCGSLLPTAARDSFWAVRAFNIEVASVRDATRGNAMTGRVRMAFWRDFVAKACRGEPIAHPLHGPLTAAIARHGHTKRWLDRIVDARDADLDAPPPATVADLELHAERSASSLLYLSLEACGVRDVHADHAASHIGKAAGIAAALRGLPVHSRLGQRYVPDELVAKHGLKEEELFITPEEVTQADGKPLIDAKAAAAEAAAKAPTPAPPAGSGAGSPAGLRMMESGGARRAREPSGAVGLDAAATPRRSTGGPRQEVGLKAQAASGMASARAADSPAAAALQSGIGASTLLLHKDAAVMEKIRGVTFDLACQARAHLDHARAMATSLPPDAAAALLPAEPISFFLDRLEAQGFDVFREGGLGPWADGRPYARLALQFKLLKHAVKNTY